MGLFSRKTASNDKSSNGLTAEQALHGAVRAAKYAEDTTTTYGYDRAADARQAAKDAANAAERAGCTTQQVEDAVNTYIRSNGRRW